MPQLTLGLLALSATACSFAGVPAMPDKSPAPVPEVEEGQAVAVLAGGCFWCLEADFDKLSGVVHTTSGFAGGSEKNPSYEEVARHRTSHLEVVRVVYDTSALSYTEVLDHFWRHVDPTDAGGQFCDRGDVYRTAILPLDDKQQQLAQASKAALESAGWLPAPVVTELRPIEEFWPAEVYHQDFYKKSPGRYEPYRQGCGRDARIALVWAEAPTDVIIGSAQPTETSASPGAKPASSEE